MAGISHDRHNIEILDANDFAPQCIRCGESARKGFYWRGFANGEIAICKECGPSIIAAMIFDLAREDNFHISWDLIKPIADAVEAGLKRISRNLDGGRLDDL